MKKKLKILILITIVGILSAFIITLLKWNSQPYYDKYQFISHALGGIDNLDYTNSQEALDYSYSRGSRLMEVDLLYTSDGHLICRHNWNQELGDGFSKENIPDYETFMASKINGIYTTLDIETIIQYAMDHPDVYFITDIKSYEFDICEALEVIKNTAEKMGYSNLDKQFIIQVYSYEDYERLSEEFSFQNYIFTLYRMKDELEENGIDNILDFCTEKDIKVVTLPKKYATEEICSKLKEKNIKIYVYTIDSKDTWSKLKAVGVDGIYTNYIYPSILNRWLVKMMTYFSAY
ncbi:MAG: glycerophosphodiester phosphodiesterase family protein [Lachnotalea sp.]